MQLITMLTRGSPLRTSVQMSGALDELPPDLAEHAAGVVREGVGNAVRHSQAAEVIITIAVDDELVVQVIDNGVGSADPVAGAGLHDLRRRASDVAGSFTVSGADGGGTRPLWTAPLPWCPDTALREHATPAHHHVMGTSAAALSPAPDDEPNRKVHRGKTSRSGAPGTAR